MCIIIKSYFGVRFRGVAKSQSEVTFYRSHTSILSIQASIPLNGSAGSWVDDFPIQRMSVLALNY
ncbi:hypothetical protein BE221DRAFT_104713 [Ostreococcus tauri]|uniref:Uncharacterized protein n=1 Tax=Ostreococcus tauri TaxID=70448 RepID=A0A1Y5I488_OSTTA|nr:hypothetical protein BE221DRAFT_104713 [Ostreococcus tauri]